MSCDWEGNRRSAVAVAMRHRLNWFLHVRAQRSSKGDEHPTNTVPRAWSAFSFTIAICLASCECRGLLWLDFGGVMFGLCGLWLDLWKQIVADSRVWCRRHCWVKKRDTVLLAVNSSDCQHYFIWDEAAPPRLRWNNVDNQCGRAAAVNPQWIRC